MMRSFLVSTVLLSSLALAQTPPKSQAQQLQLASIGLDYIDLPEKKGDFYLSTLEQAFTRSGIRVVSKSDVQTLIGIERQREMLGCTDESDSCLAEISSALGVDTVLSGQIARLGGGFAVNLKILDVRSVKVLAVFSGRAVDDEELFEVFSELAPRELAKQLKAALDGAHGSGSITVLEKVSRGSSLRSRAWIPVAVGVPLLAAATVTNVMAREAAGRVTQQPSLEEAQRVRGEGQQLQTASLLMGGGALIGLGIAGWMYASGGDTVPTVALAADGAMLGLAGTF